MVQLNHRHPADTLTGGTAMSIKRLPFFLSAAKYLNFTEAASEQFISQTAMSLQIKKFEDELGFQLFNRSNTGVTLTKAGGYLYKRCQYIMADYNQAVAHARQLSEEDKPQVRIGYSGAYEQLAVTPFVSRFYKGHPSSQVELIYGKRKKKVLQQLEDGFLDLAVVSDYDRNYSQWLKSVPLRHDNCLFLLSSDSELAASSSLEPSRLVGKPLLRTVENDFTSYEWQIWNVMNFLGLGGNEVIYANDYYSMALLAKSDIGFGIVPACMSTMPMDGLSYVPITGRTLKTSCSVIYMESSSNPVREEFLMTLKDKDTEASDGAD
ncbi:LysR substrate binding domain protein [[Clostridium] hylemonae DSM 15053]|uniref:LysR substrate binding domain protein n=2 Tax=[Clostridium] hylemonae TaxID=89153 RepID=C0BW27_9FIRM|nr:LysR substrate binding domain protein [[Clostridium] hylemonae DSM 15053]